MSNAKRDDAIKSKKKKNIWRSQQRLSAKHTIINRLTDRVAIKPQQNDHFIFDFRPKKSIRRFAAIRAETVDQKLRASKWDRTREHFANSNTIMCAVCSGTQAITHSALSFRFSAFIFAFEIYICVSCSLTRQYKRAHTQHLHMHSERARHHSYTYTNAAGGVVCARFANKMRKFANVLGIGFGFSVTVSVCSEQRIEWDRERKDRESREICLTV